MAAPLLVLALSVSALARADTLGAARSVVHQAVHAVEGDSVPAVRARWATRLAPDSADRAALLGLASLARLTYDYPASERLYARVFGADSLRADSWAAYARLGHAWSLEERGLSDAAADEFARARRTARAANDPAGEAEALIGLAFSRGPVAGMAGLAQGLAVGDALREAKLDALRHGAPAREWAAFTTVGDPLVRVPLRAPADRWQSVLRLAALVAAVAGVAWSLWRSGVAPKERLRVLSRVP